MTKPGMQKYRSWLEDASDLVVELGGSISGEHGDGQSRAELLPKMFGDDLIRAFEEFKSIWDPDWKMNPGKVVRPFRVDENLRLGADYEYVDGEVVAGIVLGWNFGDGHLHREPLLAAVQAQCGFLPGELRCIFVEGQPLGRPTMAYRIHDAATGLLDKGVLDVRAMRQRQPWAA